MSQSTPRDAINQNESKIVPDISEYKGYSDFMSKHMIKKKDNSNNIITNTRIGDSKLAISGGSYYISDAEYATFITLYYNDIVKKNKKEYLTEKQREKDLVDAELLLNFAKKAKQEEVSKIRKEKRANKQEQPLRRSKRIRNQNKV